jgi:hypothetical protein
VRTIIEHVEDLRQAGSERDHVGGELPVADESERIRSMEQYPAPVRR